MSNIERALRRAQQQQTPETSGKPPTTPPSPVEPTVVAGTWEVHPLIVGFHRRYSPAAEAFRKLAVKLLAIQRSHGDRPFVIGVTSATRGEGKSLTAANLAVVLAQDFRVPTILVDCDLRRPTFPRYFGVSLGAGLADLVKGAALEECLVGTPLPDLNLLGSGTTSNPSEIFESARVQPVLDNLRENATFVICDCPPILPVADTQLLAPNTDGLLMIVRAGESQSSQVRRMVESIEGAPVLGFVLNFADVGSPTYYHTEYYGPMDT